MGRGDDHGANSGIYEQHKGPGTGWGQLVRTLYYARLHLQGGGQSHHQLPPARIVTAISGFSALRPGNTAGELPGSHQ